MDSVARFTQIRRSDINESTWTAKQFRRGYAGTEMMESLFRDRGHFRPLARGIRLLGEMPTLTAQEELLLADLLQSADHFDFYGLHGKPPSYAWQRPACFGYKGSLGYSEGMDTDGQRHGKCSCRVIVIASPSSMNK